MGKESIEILPKFDVTEGPDGTRRARANLLTMLAVTRHLPIREIEARRLAEQEHDLLEVLIRLYCERLFEQLRRGLLHRYQTDEDNLYRLRGKLLHKEQIRRNTAHRERLYCQFDEFSADNLINQTLKAAVRKALAAVHSNDIKRKARELLFALDGVQDRNISQGDPDSLPRDRTVSRYQELIDLAAMLLFGPYPDVLAGEHQHVALLFDMASLFEEYVGRHIARLSEQLDVEVRLQGPKQWLAQEYADGAGAIDRFRLKPDITLTCDGQHVLIADTKWKQLDFNHPTLNIDQGDMYQMLAYAKRYSCKQIALIYPCTIVGERGNVLRTYRIEDVDVRIVGLDLRDLSTVPAQLLCALPILS